MSMYLSDEQSRASMAGISGRTVSWTPIILPTGPVPLPHWARGMHIDWMEQWDSPPSVVLKTTCNLRRWENKRFDRRGSMYLAEAPDGRAEIYYQDGGWSLQPLNRFRRSSDGALVTYPGINGGKVEAGEWVTVDRICTRQEEGFGGAHFDITMLDGTEVTLRGPWHGATPCGFVETAYVDRDWYLSHGRRDVRPWYKKTGIGGLWLREAVFIDLFARYYPHAKLWRLTDGERQWIEPGKPEWVEPNWVTRAKTRQEMIMARMNP